MSKRNPKWPKTKLSRPISIELYRLIKDYPTYAQWKKQVEQRHQPKDGWAPSSRHYYDSLNDELDEMPEAEIGTVSADLQEWIRGRQRELRRSKPSSAQKHDDVGELLSAMRVKRELKDKLGETHLVLVYWDGDEGKYIGEAPELDCRESGETEEEAYERICKAIEERTGELVFPPLYERPSDDQSS